ncbi:isochorismatase [Lactobacillus taiwanensis]|uniref:isochorismatase family cysteine hydrolase n=1 Tax=Lactobacillus taiwanensis TaxID=508451 RepID=UPI000B97F95E|nr:isochorismatase family cysteine hydrolase [Lactobacillus taiwanensis]OYS21874.1 isochorismatase [Lactobacillus taiwanensis]OYS24758.1 isochorismatase [Lactobacillus taiwanensis]OYS25992.1 isochorismatase [Lactobacillus taiwanensis]OYS26963.1 isochorismatase [Lactobacillus taiwanensis]OYS29642.1 isochorismatase [Lactobacillus taiwanensis]
MKKALLIIDYTNDFIADNGSLTCGKPAQALEDYLIELANKFYDNGDYVIFPTDGHTGDTFSPEYKLFPPHNIVGTPGQELYGKLKDWYEAHKSSDRVYKFNKNRYSSFQNTNLDNYLRERKINDLWLTGVCTDICVFHTAMAAYNLNYDLTIPSKGVTTSTEHGQEWALDHFKNSLGAKVIE